MFLIEQIQSEQLSPAMIDGLRRLGQAAYGNAFSEDDLAHALGGVHIVVRDDEGRWLAHASVVPRLLFVGEPALRAGYVEAVAVLAEERAKGLGTSVMEVIGELIAERYDIGVLSTGEHDFYERLGWEAWQGPSYVIGADGVRRRSEDDDDGIMVLRTAASRDLDISLAIACHDRPGDAW